MHDTGGVILFLPIHVQCRGTELSRSLVASRAVCRVSAPSSSPSKFPWTWTCHTRIHAAFFIAVSYTLSGTIILASIDELGQGTREAGGVSSLGSEQLGPVHPLGQMHVPSTLHFPPLTQGHTLVQFCQ